MSKCVKCGNEILTGDIHWEMGLCNNCYNELYKDHKTHISLDKMWLKLAQDFRDENEKLQDKVADLEAKLAEKDKAIENWQTMYESVVQTCHNDKEEIERLNKQLAEKEKEIEKLNACVDFYKSYYISFKDKVIDELEKVKETTECVLDNALKNSSLNQSYYDRLLDEIDNQIKQLKEMSNG